MTADTDPADPAALTRRLLGVSALTGTRVAGLLDRLGLTSSLASALWTVDPARPPIPMSELAQALGCDRSNVTLISDKLETAGLAERRPHPTDRRARVLRLTAAGRRLRRRLDAELAATTGLDRLTASERRQLASLLGKLDAP